MCGKKGMGAHGCFLWEMVDQVGEVSVSGGRHSGDEVRSDSGQIFLDKILYSRHLLQREQKVRVKRLIALPRP